MWNLRQRVRNGELLIGTMISEIRNPNVAFLLADAAARSVTELKAQGPKVR